MPPIPSFNLAIVSPTSGSQRPARSSPRSPPGARVVKVANTLRAALLAAEPRESGGHRVLFMAGDDSDAKSRVNAILESVGFASVDLGSLQSGGPLQQFPGGCRIST
jgi:predicted dinucleotide-binding enzyme